MAHYIKQINEASIEWNQHFDEFINSVDYQTFLTTVDPQQRKIQLKNKLVKIIGKTKKVKFFKIILFIYLFSFAKI